MTESDLDVVRRIYAEGIATGARHLRDQRPRPPPPCGASGSPTTAGSPRSTGPSSAGPPRCATSQRDCYAGVAETSVYVAEGARGRGVGKALLHRQVNAADAGGLWTLQTSIFPENRASLALHHSAGYRTLAVRDRIAQLDGVWRDTVCSNDAGPTDPATACPPTTRRRR